MNIEILTGEDLFDRVRSQPDNADLLLVRRADDGKEQCRFKYLYADMVNDDLLFAVCDGERIVAMSQLGKNPFEPPIVWVKFVSVEQAHRGKGYARALIEAMYEHAIATGGKVEPSSFTELGQRLKHIFSECDERFPNAAAGKPQRDFF